MAGKTPPNSVQGHYFTRQPTAASRPRLVQVLVEGEELAFVVDRGVFSSRGLDAGTRLLLASLGDVKGRAVLDLGCGWGAIGLIALHRGAARCVMVDVNERALACVRASATGWQVAPDIRQGDGFSAIAAGERFDVIATNPPVRAGKDVYYPWVARAASHLAPGGRFLAVARVRQGARSFEVEMGRHFRRVERRARAGGYWVLAGRDPGAC